MEEGDIIEIDIPNRSINLAVPEDVLAKRRENWVPKKRELASKWLRRYAKLATSADSGGILSDN